MSSVMLSIGEFARLGGVSPRMLRHYDELGLLKPERVDPRTGYRAYEFAQLASLHRLVALRDLGLSLQRIGEVLPEDPTVEQLRGMLRLRRAELEQQLTEDEARLRRVEAHLRALDGGAVVSNLDVVMKRSEPIRVVEVQGRAAGFGHENLEPVFERLVPQVLDAVRERGTTPGMMVAWYDEPDDDGSVVVHVGFDIGEQDYNPLEPTSVTVLPTVRVASVVHKGPMDDIGLVYEALVGWIDASGERLAGRSRELYRHQDEEHPDRSVTELQMPIAAN